MTVDVKALLEHGDHLFGQRTGLLSLWQQQAEHFYPERADFTSTRNLGDDFASYLNTSYPLITRRELGSSLSGMLRPRDEEWFAASVDNSDKLDRAGKVWLESATEVQRRAMYDPISQFVRATKEGDHDFVTFGQCVISAEWDPLESALLYRCWHLRDVAWSEKYNGTIGAVHANWKPTCSDLYTRLGDRVHKKVADQAKGPRRHEPMNCRRISLPSSEYESVLGKKWRTPHVIVTIDVDHKHVMEEVGSWVPGFRVPRWQTVSGTQYAYSPATIAALPDARLIQAMTLTLLEAGEMALRPPLIAVRQAIRSDIQQFAGGTTWIDEAYDERLADVIKPIPQDFRGMPFGQELSKEIEQRLYSAFYLNKISLPPTEREMTAFEAGERVKDYIRAALPLFEPMETEYNAGLCLDTFELLLRWGAFGSPDQIPQSLRGDKVTHKFKSPLHDAIERKKGVKFQEARQLILEAAEMDPSAAAILDVRAAAREALEGIGTPAGWTRDEQTVEQLAAQHAQQEQAKQFAATLQAGAAAAEQVGQANKALSAEGT